MVTDTFALLLCRYASLNHRIGKTARKRKPVAEIAEGRLEKQQPKCYI